ncbi:hypothetical protein [Pseudonocardia sp. ICBG1293]|uniref:hypothetical protein n=1 Tax=Pseudonocardia sp. ICBG1293 TaxID=2844382 RepID=UPI001CCE8CC6|nr:hypothetical protein [Pseudonocardia sp. ICBG1293]
MQTAAAVQTLATTLLAGIAWAVQGVVYPAFALVPADAWARYHAAHGRAVTIVVGPPWVVQGLATVALLLLAPGEPLVWAAAVTAAAGVVVTLPAVSLHARLDPAAHPGDLRRLLRVNLARALVWSAGAVVGVLLTTASGA